MPGARRTHRILGLVLLLPILGWASTGLVFFVKPGYANAYGPIRVRAYPLEGSIAEARPGWLEARSLRSILGEHRCVRTEGGWIQVDDEGKPRSLPDDGSLRRLLEDAISVDRDRYGVIVSIERHEGDSPSATARTSTGVAIDLDWSTLAMRQEGSDTRRIDRLYRIHYLQWTGIAAVDRVLGVAGIAALVLLAALGIQLARG